MGVGKRIRQVRGTRSQREFAAILDVDQNTLSKWELDKQTPPMSRLQEIADLGGVPLGWLFASDGDGEDESGGPTPDAFLSRRLDQVERDLRAMRDEFRRVREDLERAVRSLRDRREEP